MIVGDLDIDGFGAGPNETHAVLVVDADRVLTRAISLKGFQMVARWDSQLFQTADRVDCGKLPSRHVHQLNREQGARRFGVDTIEDILRAATLQLHR